MRVRVRDDVSLFGLTAGKEYTVIGLDDEYFRVLDYEAEPVLFPRSAFVVLDDRVPADWVWNRCTPEEFYADPPELCAPGFYEDYFDGKEYAVEVFTAYAERAGLDLSTGAVTVYVHLLDEGTTVMRPTQGVPLGGDVYLLQRTPDYDPDDEHWEFPPGRIVRCVKEKIDGEEALIAREEVDPEN